MSAATRSPLRSLRSLRGERATPLRVNSKPDTLCALKPDTSICPQHILRFRWGQRYLNRGAREALLFYIIQCVITFVEENHGL